MSVLIIKAYKNGKINKILDLCKLKLEENGENFTEIEIEEAMTDKLHDAKALIIATDMILNNIPWELQRFFQLSKENNNLIDKPVLTIVFSDDNKAIDGYKIILENIINLECVDVGKILNYKQYINQTYIENQIKNLLINIKTERIQAKPDEKLKQKIKNPKLESYAKQNNKDEGKTVNKNEDDIIELAELFKRQLSQKIGTEIPQNTKGSVPDTTSEQITVKQMTKNLEHYFQPQLATDINSTYQIITSGAEEFNCFLTIKNKACTYKEGVKENSEVIINVDSNTWKSILIGSLSAQKAFMTGKIKVKGDFSLLAKFDKIFKKM